VAAANSGQNTPSISVSPEEGKFNFYTYGWGHRVGLNQYGAYGRALGGQSAEQILLAYYNVGVSIVKENTEDKKIHVLGYSDVEKVCDENKQGCVPKYYDEVMSFEDKYLLGISEMIASWGNTGGYEALKAGVIAARTYAMTRGTIQPNQNDQVYNETHINSSTYAGWRRAVEETRGMVLKDGNGYISALYSSTAAGATIPASQARDIFSRPYFLHDLPYSPGIIDVNPANGKAWDVISPLYHWCSGNQPNLTKSEVIDLINTALLPAAKYDNLKISSSSAGGLKPEEVLEALKNEGIDSVMDFSSIELNLSPQHTTGFHVITAKGTVNVDPERFRLVFNLRSPGTDAIWTTKFDVETN